MWFWNRRAWHLEQSRGGPVKVLARAYVLSCVQLFVTPLTTARQAPQSMEFFRQEYWSGLSLPSPGYFPDAGIKLSSFTSSPMAGRFFKIYHKFCLGSPLHTLAIVNSDAMNIGVHTSFWISVFVSFEYIPRSGIS